jgi:hypothetical protein
VSKPTWVNNAVCLDTGCVFGGRLSALRWPEQEIVSVPADRVWFARRLHRVEETSPPGEETPHARIVSAVQP